MEQEIRESLQSYVDLLEKIEEISKKFNSAQKHFKTYRILAQVAAVAAGALIVGVCVRAYVAPTFSLPLAFSCGVPRLFPFGMLGAFAYFVFEGLWRFPRKIDRFEKTIVLLERLRDEVNLVRSEWRFIKSDFIGLLTTLDNEKRSIDIAAHHVRGQDVTNQEGHQVIGTCDEMEKKSKALKERIEFLRNHVNKIQRSRYQYR